MRTIVFILILITASMSHAEKVRKWVDEDGQVHYGDRKAARSEAVGDVEKVVVDDAVDKKTYEEAVERNKQEDKEIRKDQLFKGR